MKRSIVTLGTFDGVHLGHQAILKKLVQRAHRRRIPSIVLAFGMPPRFVRSAHSAPILLTTLEEKRAILKSIGIDRLRVLTFDRKTASTPADAFFEQTILKDCGAEEMVVGPRIAFGKNRAGRLPLVRQLGRHHGVRIDVVRGVRQAGQPISSRRIRAALMRGNVESARAMLGRPYSVEGRVVHGDGRGRRLGIPTANIEIDSRKMLPPGVFWVKVVSGHRSHVLGGRELRNLPDGLCNVGTRPTFAPNGRQIFCEVYFLKRPRRPLYGRHFRVLFMRRIRTERRFASAVGLLRQIARDQRSAEEQSRRFALHGWQTFAII
ncbi:MAG TPA: riboflavin biosynthesis protein RibF [Elusimicrobiota bacterium]|nr:riboflavin biosynthesis protein RibF [Elusimicrobiota bacterium]